MDVTVKELQLRTRDILAATDRKETVFITDRGERRAVLTHWQAPFHTLAPEQRRNPAFGIWGG